MPDIVKEIVDEALNKRASDIHIDPYKDFVEIRFRIDGLLENIKRLPIDIHQNLLARIKILANMRVDEHLKAQDGRWAYENVDIRVSVMPTKYGENAVLRILKKNQITPNLIDLGMNKEEEEIVLEIIKKGRGLILISGPTGSGKTSTLYSLLSYIKDEKKMITTIEDPIEYEIENGRQIQVSSMLSFANGLRGLMRQDPDVIMIGEIRDKETAEIAVHAALTGHLVLSTIHSYSAKEIFYRLLDFKISEYIINSVLVLSISQRLLRKKKDDWYEGRFAIYEIKKGEDDYKKFKDKCAEIIQKGITTKEEIERVFGKS